MENTQEIPITPVKKRVNSKSKGSSFEGTIAKKFSAAFDPLKFARTPGSGARIGGKNFGSIGQFFSDAVKSVFVGDVVPMNENDHGLKFTKVIECKFYRDAEKLEVLLNGKSKIYGWLNEVLIDAVKVEGKSGIVVFKWNNTPIYCAVDDQTVLPESINKIIIQKNIQVCYFDELLKFRDFWISPIQ